MFSLFREPLSPNVVIVRNVSEMISGHSHNIDLTLFILGLFGAQN